MKEKLKKYFQTFSNKDLDGLSEMFSETVILADWNISVFGKKDVLDANKGIFDSVNSIAVNPYAYYGGNNAYAVELTIEVDIDGKIEELQVVDVITFDEEGLIDTIKAYKK
jgi:hypothetical protein